MKNPITSRLFLFFLLAPAFFILTEGCKKENRILKNLHSDGGKWKISKAYYSYSSSADPSDFFEMSLNDCGEFIFRENGTGTLTLTLPGEPSEITNFTYKVLSDTKISISFEGDTVEFTMEWKKNKLKLEHKHIYTGYVSGETITEITRYELDKLK